jgi:PAS domain-containing protein
VLALFDIDAPKRYEASVRSATELAEALLKASSSPAVLLDSTLRIRSANTRFVELMGLHADGLQGRPLSEVARPGDGYAALAAPADGTGGSQAVGTVELHPSPAGQPLAFDARSFPAFDGTSGRLVLLTSRQGADGAAVTS